MKENYSKVELNLISIENIISNKNLDFNYRVEKGLELLEDVKILKKVRRELYIYYYRILRELGSLYFQTNCNYNDAEKYFELSLDFKQKYNYIDSMINECISKQMLAKVKLMIFLNTKNKKKLDEAKKLIDFLVLNVSGDKLKKEISELKEIYSSILNNNLKTVINFVVPTHLILLEEESISFTYKGILCNVSSMTIRNNNSLLIDGNNLYSQKDKYGIINRSIISVTIGEYINPNELINVNKSIKEVYKPLSRAIDVYNYFLKKYIISTDKYWMIEINEKMIFNYEIKVYAGDVEIKNIPLSMSIELSSLGDKLPIINEEELYRLKMNLLSEDIALWKLAYNNAKDYYLVKDYKNSIIMINIALENFIYSYSYNNLSKNMSESELANFFDGDIKYEDYFLKEYITEEKFNLAKNNNVIKNNPPTIYRLCSELYKYKEYNITKSQLLKKISVIKDQRNEIVHGKVITKSLQSVIEKAILSFEEIINCL